MFVDWNVSSLIFKMKNDFVNDELCNKISCVAERRNFEFGAQQSLLYNGIKLFNELLNELEDSQIVFKRKLLIHLKFNLRKKHVIQLRTHLQ